MDPEEMRRWGSEYRGFGFKWRECEVECEVECEFECDWEWECELVLALMLEDRSTPRSLRSGPTLTGGGWRSGVMDVADCSDGTDRSE